MLEINLNNQYLTMSAVWFMQSFPQTMLLF